LLIGGQPAAKAPGVPARGSTSVKLKPGQELLFGGSFTEEARLGTVHYRRSYRLQTRLFVLKRDLVGVELVVLTAVHPQEQSAPPDALGERPSASIRLDTVWVSPEGEAVTGGDRPWVCPLDDLPTFEVGFFVPLPDGPLTSDRKWANEEPGRPLHHWRVTGVELVHGKRCWVVEGEQRSPEWDSPRADRRGWRRLDRVWLAADEGFAVRVERTIEKRAPAYVDTTHKCTLRYDLQSDLTYPGQLGNDRVEEITQTRFFQKQGAALAPQGLSAQRQLDTLLAQIDDHLQRVAPTPYRPALVQVRKEVEAVKRGAPPRGTPLSSPGKEEEVQPANSSLDFLASSLPDEKTVRSREWRGKPTLLIFYRPQSDTSPGLLSFAQGLHDNLKQLRVVGLPVSDDVDQVMKQREQYGLSFPLVKGNGLRTTCKVEATPKFVLLDETGSICASFLGWGEGIPTELALVLRRWLRDPH
jgi:hypothetical protein